MGQLPRLCPSPSGDDGLASVASASTIDTIASVRTLHSNDPSVAMLSIQALCHLSAYLCGLLDGWRKWSSPTPRPPLLLARAIPLTGTVSVELAVAAFESICACAADWGAASCSPVEAGLAAVDAIHRVLDMAAALGATATPRKGAGPPPHGPATTAEHARLHHVFDMRLRDPVQAELLSSYLLDQLWDVQEMTELLARVGAPVDLSAHADGIPFDDAEPQQAKSRPEGRLALHDLIQREYTRKLVRNSRRFGGGPGSRGEGGGDGDGTDDASDGPSGELLDPDFLGQLSALTPSPIASLTGGSKSEPVPPPPSPADPLCSDKDTEHAFAPAGLAQPVASRSGDGSSRKKGRRESPAAGAWHSEDEATGRSGRPGRAHARGDHGLSGRRTRAYGEAAKAEPNARSRARIAAWRVVGMENGDVEDSYVVPSHMHPFHPALLVAAMCAERRRLADAAAAARPTTEDDTGAKIATSAAIAMTRMVRTTGLTFGTSHGSSPSTSSAFPTPDPSPSPHAAGRQPLSWVGHESETRRPGRRVWPRPPRPHLPARGEWRRWRHTQPASGGGPSGACQR